MKEDIKEELVTCMHCRVQFSAAPIEFVLGQDPDSCWSIFLYACPSCKRMNLFLVNGVPYWGDRFAVSKYSPKVKGAGIEKVLAIHPFSVTRPPCPSEVPLDIASDYKEACLVLPFSAKASAALSRRCLQNLLRQAAKVKPSDLSKEIQEIIDSGKLPTQLSDSIDAIRNIGNFAVHPVKSKSTSEIVDVEPEEAEWNLDVLELLFDFYYVQPARISQKRESLNTKLSEAGKPLMKKK